MKTKLILAMSAALALGIAACGGDDKDDDTPTVTDAGITVPDAGPQTTDAAVEPTDAATEPEDASTEPEDASVEPEDASEPPTGIAKIVISQIYLGGTSAESESYDHTYVELFNAGDIEVNLNDYEFLYGGKSGEVSLAVHFSDLTGCANDGCKIAAESHFLMQIKTTHSGEGILPVPFDLDLEGSPNIGESGTFGIAAVSSGLQAASSCADVKAKAMDMVGIGTATKPNECSEHPATGISSAEGNRGSKVYMRRDGGCVDTDNDSNDFVVADPNPRNLQSGFNVCNAE